MSNLPSRLTAILLVALTSCSDPESFAGVSADHPTGSPTISAEGLVAAYDMETLTPDGRLRDFGPLGLHGGFYADTTSGLQPSEPGVEATFGQGRLFGTPGRRVELPSAPEFDIPGPLTIAVRLRVDGLDLHQHIVACDDSWALWITPDNQYRLGDTRGGGWSTEAGFVRPGQWTSLVAVLRGTRGDPLNGGTVSLYVDGAPAPAAAVMRSDDAEARNAWGPGDLYPTDACYVGFESHQGNPAHQQMPFAGAVDELLIFSRPWTAEEVAAFSQP